VEGGAGRLGGGYVCDLDGDVAVAVGEWQQPRPPLGVVSSCDLITRVRVDDRDLGADPVGVRAADRQLVAVGDDLRDWQLDPIAPQSWIWL
jgi:hypothetical protein